MLRHMVIKTAILDLPAEIGPLKCLDPSGLEMPRE